MQSALLLDCAGRRRSPATLPGYHQGRPPRNSTRRWTDLSSSTSMDSTRRCVQAF
jgi:hypothetical protein